MALVLVLPLSIFASRMLRSQQLQPQEQQPQPTAQQPAAQSDPQPAAPIPGPVTTQTGDRTTMAALLDTPKQPAPVPGEYTEDFLRQMFVGKQLFLRGGYLGDSLSFTEYGDPEGHPAVGSFTLSVVEIDKVHLTKRKVEFEGNRYALHFLGAMPYEDASNALDRVKITPKKKVLRISIDREHTEKEKKENALPQPAGQSRTAVSGPGANGNAQAKPEPVASSESDAAAPAPSPEATPQAAPQPTAAPPQNQKPKLKQGKEKQANSESAQAAHAAKTLHDALDKVFAQGLDDKMRAKMPEFWQRYFEAQAAGVDYRPRDPGVLRSNAVDTQAKVVSSIAPDSNEFAQASGIAGRALYRVVIGIDGRPGEIAVVRPIGFGLDENAVAAIRKATFEPATKAGRPAAESLDLAVVFRIYSKRTAGTAGEAAPSAPVKPGPYSAGQQPEKQP
jgi:protein TonB